MRPPPAHDPAGAYRQVGASSCAGQEPPIFDFETDVTDSLVLVDELPERFVARRPTAPEGIDGLTAPPPAAPTPAAPRPSAPAPAADPPAAVRSAGGQPPGAPPATKRVLAGRLSEAFGILADLVAEPDVTDIFVNGSAGTWIDRGRGLRRVPGVNPTEPDLRALAVRLVSLGGRHIDEASPCVDARLGDGIRVHAVLPPISPSGTLLSIRMPLRDRPTLESLDVDGFFATVSRETVEALVAKRENILVTGAGGSGKTTLLSAVLAGASSVERIIAVEDVAELRVDHPHFVALEARQANLEGAGALGLERLVREALRMRPDRLVLGECRGAEIRDLLAALNTGHDGGAGTLHANSLEDVPARLEALGAIAEMSPVAIARQTVSAIGTVLHLERTGTSRRIAQIGRFALDGRDRLMVVPPDAGLTDAGAHEAPARTRGLHAARASR